MLHRARVEDVVAAAVASLLVRRLPREVAHVEVGVQLGERVSALAKKRQVVGVLEVVLVHLGAKGADGLLPLLDRTHLRTKQAKAAGLVFYPVRNEIEVLGW